EGGAFYNRNRGGKAIFEDVVLFEDNEAGFGGGGVYNGDEGEVTFNERVTFHSNSAEETETTMLGFCFCSAHQEVLRVRLEI
ncbi:unnamed protein product, partial [Discosporangium mesarthrocarpum]